MSIFFGRISKFGDILLLFSISKEEVEEQLENSKIFISAVEEFLNTKY